MKSPRPSLAEKAAGKGVFGLSGRCLLYTSDAADEEDSVDLGGRRIIKKKTRKKKKKEKRVRKREMREQKRETA